MQRELTSFAYEWNNHRMRQSRMADVPGGIPEVLFHLPHSQGLSSIYKLLYNWAKNHTGSWHTLLIMKLLFLYIGVMDQLCPVEPNLLQDIQADGSHMPLMCSLSFKSLADHLARRFNLPVPALNIHQACQSYFAIVHFLDTIA